MRINEATKLTCSAGISCNRMLAKICSDLNKPNGQSYLEPEKAKIIDFMDKLPLRKVPNIGGMRETMLNSMGIKNCKDIREKAADLMIALTENEFSFLIRCSLGIGQTVHGFAEDDTDDQKGISVSETFRPLKTLPEFKQKIWELSVELSKRMENKQLTGRVVLVGLKTTDFSQKSI